MVDTRITPTVSQPTRTDWLSWYEQLAAHWTPMLDAAANAGMHVVEASIPGGALISVFVGEKVVDELVDQGVKVLGSLIAQIPNVEVDATTHPVGAYVIQMIENSGPKLAAALGPKLDELVKAGLVKAGLKI